MHTSYLVKEVIDCEHLRSNNRTRQNVTVLYGLTQMPGEKHQRSPVRKDEAAFICLSYIIIMVCNLF